MATPKPATLRQEEGDHRFSIEGKPYSHIKASRNDPRSSWDTLDIEAHIEALRNDPQPRGESSGIIPHDVKNARSSLSNEVNKYYDDSLDDDWEDRPWIEMINSFAYLKGSSTGINESRDQIGSCRCALIRREMTGRDFHREMEEPTEETSALAFDFFDQHGRLRNEFKQHSIKRRSGVWGDEMDHGDLLLRLVNAILGETRRKSPTFFAVARSAVPTHYEPNVAEMTEDRKWVLHDKEEEIITCFLRSLGLRRVGSTEWFALSSESGHPFHKMQASHDYDPPKVTVREQDPVMRALFRSVNVLDDERCLVKLQSSVKVSSMTDELWSSTDKMGNTYSISQVARNTLDVSSDSLRLVPVSDRYAIVYTKLLSSLLLAISRNSEPRGNTGR
ncbi:hypothetical protein F5Y15DRAFT_273861 [Xylariaceae sp. FL0016]|nr:hypothetical protein F5Y15DRAFT_273861 [Xylariaceae sp. FL0016]